MFSDMFVKNWKTTLMGFAVLGYALAETLGYSHCGGDPSIHILSGIGLIIAKDANITTHKPT